MANILKDVEAKYPVNKILVDGNQIWPYLRASYDFVYTKIVCEKIGERSSNSKETFARRLKALLPKLGNSLYGFRNWFGKYEFIAFSDTTERKSIDGKYVNKLLDPIIDELGRDKVLYVELPAPRLYPIKQVYTERIVCRDFLDLSGLILDRFMPRRYVIQNEFTLKNIQKEYGFEIDDMKIVRFFNAQRRVFHLLFRRIKPKAILLSEYYGPGQAAVKAAKDLGIRVIEFQHGAIGKEHPEYNVYCEIDRSYFPDYLLVFGKKEMETFDNARFIEPKNVFPIGDFYIEYIKKNASQCALAKLSKNYSTSVGVTLQETVEKRAIEFVCQAAYLDSDILYLLIPRKPKGKRYDTLDLPPNVVVIKDLNFYELMICVDFHSTVYSTCALEAPSLGVQNILINIDGLSKQFYGPVLDDDRITRYVETPEELVKSISTFEKIDRDTACKLNEDIIAIDYRKNIQNFIAEHLQPLLSKEGR